MKDIDIDDLLNDINNTTESTTKKKKNKKKNKTEDKTVNNEEIKTDKIEQIEESVNAIKLNPEIDNKAVNEVVEEDKKKKKRRGKHKKKGDKEEAGDDNDNDENNDKNAEEEVRNKWRSLFDFSDKEITNSRFQDNESVFRVVKNWEDKPWGQT